ncbi:hypothetical protein GCM10009087_33140 [Sphingomonas oligophenolica]|uniref:Uncharacterized protein n=1 Tax=Sphingomonas oligophenolica TaxID=301154 RepID=A0ABU9XYL9_9SPHN
MYELVNAWFRATVRPTLFQVALLTGVFASAHAFAQEYPARDVGGWTVAASKDKSGCFMTRTYEGAGATSLFLGVDVDGGNRLTVLNENWSIQPKDQWKLTFRLSRGGYSDHPVVGIALDGKRGFVTNFETKFPTYFAASRTLYIYRGDVPVEQLSLDGSGAAVAELRRCVDVFRANAAAGPEGRSDQIPKDPFAPDAGRKSKD